MLEDVESDFWKDVFVHMQHKNMVRTNGTTLTLAQAPSAFLEFEQKNPLYHPEITKTESYITWELFITSTIKLRLFIQNGIKATLLQKNNGDLVKIADAKFYVNPFPEIEEILANSGTLESELSDSIEKNAKNKKKQKLAGEFIKAILHQRFSGKDINWNLIYCKTDFELKVERPYGLTAATENKLESQTFKISVENYKNDIEQALKNLNF